jgi:hypothetical protein
MPQAAKITEVKDKVQPAPMAEVPQLKRAANKFIANPIS